MRKPNKITITWHIDDVLKTRPDLTDKQAREVLQEVAAAYDADYGINWETLEDCTDMLFPNQDSL